MLNMIKVRVGEVISSSRGAGTIILLFTLIPLILFVPLVAIDVNMYLLTKAQLQNSLDAAATTALNKSTDDRYRAEKVLKVITKDSSPNNFINNLKEGIYNNFNPVNNYIHVKKEKYNGNTYMKNILTFTPGFNFTQTPVDLVVEYGSKLQGNKYTGGNLSDFYGFDSIKLTLTADVVLPTMSKMYKFLGGSEVFKTSVTVHSGVTGIRVLRSDASDQLNNYDWAK